MATVEDRIRDVFDYCVRSEALAIAHIMDDARDGLTGPKRQFHYRYGLAGINPINYGIHQALLPAIKRIESEALRERAIEWLVLQIHDTIACFWQSMATSGKPPGEGGRIEGGRYVNADSDILRHVDCAGICDAARDPEMVAAGLDTAAVTAMVEEWGDWLTRVFYGEKGPKHKREIHRMGLPLNSLVGIYELTRNRAWLAKASWLLHWGWGDDMRRTKLADDTACWPSYDTGYPWEERGGYLGGDITSWPWYDGDFGNAALRMYPHVDEDTRAILKNRTVEISDRYVLRDRVNLMWDGVRRNTQLHGGVEGQSTPWVMKDSTIQTPAEMLLMPDDEPRHILRALYWFEVDGRYMDKYHIAPDGSIRAPRDHHNDRDPSPKLVRDGAQVATLLYARSLASMDPDDRLLAIQAMFDYKAFANQSGHVYMPKKKASRDWYVDAAGKNRLLAWRFLSGWPILKAEWRNKGGMGA